MHTSTESRKEGKTVRGAPYSYGGAPDPRLLTYAQAERAVLRFFSLLGLTDFD